METDTVLLEEQQRVERLTRARRFDAAKNVVTNLARVVENNTKRLEPLRAQLKNLDEMETSVGKMDGTIPGASSFMARDQIIIQLVAARNWVDTRLAKAEKQLADQRKQLAAAEAIVAEFDK